MSARPRALVLGGYGNFGAIIASRIAADRGIEVIVAGRNEERAREFANSIGAAAMRIDADAPDLAEQFARSEAQLVVSTAGPYQGQDYRVARAAIEAGIHYVDIADGREFVCGIGALDAEASRRGVLVVSGASSVPALSSAVVDRYVGEFAELRDIDMGISASEKVPGLSTVRGILAYCGKPFAQWSEGQWRTVHGWQSIRRRDFGGATGKRWICDCDVPDLSLLPARHPSLRTVRFGAGVELTIVQWGLWALSWTVRAGAVSDASRFAAVLRAAAVALERFGSGRSGMFMRLEGTGRDGGTLVREWHIAAHSNRGVNIPCLGAVALARKILRGGIAARGASPCVGFLTLDEYLAEAGDILAA
jgi:hypothetical protein